MKVIAKGIVGVVYETKQGFEEYNSNNLPNFGVKGWEQITPTIRRLVVRKYSNSKRIIWEARKFEDDFRPMDHRLDGELF